MELSRRIVTPPLQALEAAVNNVKNRRKRRREASRSSRRSYVTPETTSKIGLDRNEEQPRREHDCLARTIRIVQLLISEIKGSSGGSWRSRIRTSAEREERLKELVSLDALNLQMLELEQNFNEALTMTQSTGPATTLETSQNDIAISMALLREKFIQDIAALEEHLDNNVLIPLTNRRTDSKDLDFSSLETHLESFKQDLVAAVAARKGTPESTASPARVQAGATKEGNAGDNPVQQSTGHIVVSKFRVKPVNQSR